MEEVVVMVGVAATAFVSTNLDNLFLLMGFASGEHTRTRSVVIGYVGALAVVLSLGLAASLAIDLAADAWLRFLGLVPLGLGLWRLAGLLRGAAAVPGVAAPTPSAGAASVFGVMLANSGDSLGVFTSLMGETEEFLLLAIVATALILAGVWAAMARWLVDRPALAPPLRTIDRYAVPPLLISIGLYILLDTPTDTV